MKSITSSFCRKLNRQRGASLVEYSLSIALISLVAMASINFVGGNESELYDCLSGNISDPEHAQLCLASQGETSCGSQGSGSGCGAAPGGSGG